MSTSYASFIKYVREERNLSQALVAERCKMSRASYVAVEKGTKELTLAEAEAITQLFGITIDELLRTQAPDHAKYIQMILAVLRCAKKGKVAIKKTKLANVLYLADFAWYYTEQKSMSGLPYRKIDFGPMADAYFRLLEEMEQRGSINVKQIYRDDYHMYEIEETRASEKMVLALLNTRERALIEKIWNQWQNASTAEITKFTQEQAPYRESVSGEVIPYTLISQEDSYSIF